MLNALGAVILAGSLSLAPSAFEAAHTQFVEGARHDSARIGSSAQGPNLVEFRQRVNARRIDAALREMRSDGFSANASYHLAQDLEFLHNEVLTEEFPIPTAMQFFPVDTSVPVGAREHKIRRIWSFGQARVYRGPGSEIPRVGVNQREESWPIRHLVVGYGWDIFEAASDRFAGRGRLQQLARAARDSLMELANRIWWGLTGSQHGLYGVINYPWLSKKEMPTGFSKATIVANPDTILQDLHDLVNYPHQQSKSTFYPTHLVMTNRVRDRLSQVRFGAGSDTTILQHFLANNAHIQAVEVAWELENIGGDGVDGILAYRKDTRGIQVVMPQGVTQLPVQQNGLQSEIINYMSIGGVTMYDVLNNILGLADTTA